MADIIFDSSKDWTILAPPDNQAAVLRLARFIAELRRKTAALAEPEGASACSGVPDGNASDYTDMLPRIIDGTTTQEGDSQILVNYDASSQKTAYAWRVGSDRIEIYAHSLDSLTNAVSDFIAAFDTAHPAGSCWPLTKKGNYSFA